MSQDNTTPVLLPPVDVVEDANGITLYADLPGVPRDGLNLQVDGDQLTIEGELRLDLPEGLQPSHAEVSLQRYRRQFTLSKELDAAQVSAELAEGVLRVRIPKVAHLQPKRIEVQVG
jgi:HSP20 family molecular chaperone IbpA